MELMGETRIEAPRQLVWEALNNPKVLQQSIPGCEELSRTADNEFSATVVSKVGPIKARFSGKVSLSNIDAPRSYTLTGEGQGGAAGFVRSDIDVSLDAPEPRVTILRYGVKANVGGKLAQLGSRMIDAAARKSADEFFASFCRTVEGRATEADTVEALPSWIPLGDSAASAASTTHMQAPAAPRVASPLPPQTTLPLPPQTTEGATEGTPKELMDVWTSGHIKIWISDQIAVITLNRPSSRNAMTYAMWCAVPGLMAALDRNPDVRSIILTGAGDDFCAGADIPEFEQVRSSVEQATAYEVAVDACCDAIANVGKPTIAVIKGYCLGGGAHLAMSCDFRFASANAIFGIPAARLSIIYGVRGTQKLFSLVGAARAKHILYSAERFDAATAMKWGFVDDVTGTAVDRSRHWWAFAAQKQQSATQVPDPTAAARAYARKLADNAPLSIAGAKFILNGLSMGTGAVDLNAAETRIAAAAGSEDYKEGRAAFAAKRPARFQGH